VSPIYQDISPVYLELDNPTNEHYELPTYVPAPPPYECRAPASDNATVKYMNQPDHSMI